MDVQQITGILIRKKKSTMHGAQPQPTCNRVVHVVQASRSHSSKAGAERLPVKPTAVLVQSITCCCTATLIAEAVLDLGLLALSGTSGKGVFGESGKRLSGSTAKHIQMLHSGMYNMWKTP